MKYSRYSVVVVGSGISGLYAALKITQQINLSDGLLLMTKSKISDCNSRYAQGGIVGVLKENIKDSVESHVKDTLIAGAGLSDEETVKFISENSDAVIKDLLSFGVEFDKNEKDELNFTLEGAHSVNRILHAGGDATGFHMESALAKKAIENPDIEIYEETIAADLLVDSDSKCKGLIAYNNLTGEYETIYASAVILACGGLGQLYKYTTNPSVATGDGMAIAYNAGAIMQDMEFIQFHPTALSLDNSKNRFLISEAVRGEGAKLVNKDGKEFMSKYHDKRELAPRDIVTRAIFNEMMEHKASKMFLNATIIDKRKLALRFPTISKTCKDSGINIENDYIPVSPAAHYSMGGIKTNIEGRTSLRGLYAIGEVASTGLHGGNRLASNSLLECVVSAYELANYLTFSNLTPPKQIDENIKKTIELYTEDLDSQDYDIAELKAKLQDIMWTYVGVLRSEKSLKTALLEINKLKLNFRKTQKCLNKEEYEYRNMLTVARLVIEGALNRKESRGAHYRTDYKTANEVAMHNCMVNKEGEPQIVK